MDRRYDPEPRRDRDEQHLERRDSEREACGDRAASDPTLANSADVARGYGRAGEGAGDALNATTITGSGMDTGLGMGNAPGMHSHSGTGTSGNIASGLGTTTMPGVGTPGAATRSGRFGTMPGMSGGSAGSQSPVVEGMAVVAADGEKVGTVKKVRDGDFLLERSGRRDLVVPFDALGTVEDGQVRLRFNAGEIDELGWGNPGMSEIVDQPDIGDSTR